MVIRADPCSLQNPGPRACGPTRCAPRPAVRPRRHCGMPGRPGCRHAAPGKVKVTAFFLASSVLRCGAEGCLGPTKVCSQWSGAPRSVRGQGLCAPQRGVDPHPRVTLCTLFGSRTLTHRGGSRWGFRERVSFRKPASWPRRAPARLGAAAPPARAPGRESPGLRPLPPADFDRGGSQSARTGGASPCQIRG